MRGSRLVGPDREVSQVRSPAEQASGYRTVKEPVTRLLLLAAILMAVSSSLVSCASSSEGARNIALRLYQDHASECHARLVDGPPQPIDFTAGRKVVAWDFAANWVQTGNQFFVDEGYYTGDSDERSKVPDPIVADSLDDKLVFAIISDKSRTHVGNYGNGPGAYSETANLCIINYPESTVVGS
jgi:hypothetical protein